MLPTISAAHFSLNFIQYSRLISHKAPDLRKRNIENHKSLWKGGEAKGSFNGYTKWLSFLCELWTNFDVHINFPLDNSSVYGFERLNTYKNLFFWGKTRKWNAE